MRSASDSEWISFQPSKQMGNTSGSLFLMCQTGFILVADLTSYFCFDCMTYNLQPRDLQPCEPIAFVSCHYTAPGKQTGCTINLFSSMLDSGPVTDCSHRAQSQAVLPPSAPPVPSSESLSVSPPSHPSLPSPRFSQLCSYATALASQQA